MKTANYSVRRLEVTEAAWRVIIHEGLDRASMRAIAQELGSTTGVVTHYFRDKDELMLFALERVFENLFQDMEICAKGKHGIERLEQMIFAALPFEPSGMQGWQIWLAFLGYAIGRKKLIEEHRKRYDSLRQVICQELADLQIAKLIREDINLMLEANALIALVDGIGTGYVINPEQFHPDQQRYLVQRHIRTSLVAS
ncbi:TetR/AcrR family transcriptional regulator [Nostocaceae cyanobacterium CENA357]|uniref:TetR/AcrR family transcriptional regulator n=1 Tax=Atlanticothrix silvestris CENA357 TaxID=1725252 RepID=A0A8J7HJP6_9CYAN|nr:TetR/AcrR family transcriptional regulator [Atlanticothrix silvestris]MBH8553773.1 TetR/AcrR family transcriptional regulator [Atlanticothrix silvestris CENA357]